MTTDQDLAGLSDSAPEALRRFRAQITGHPLTVGEKGAVLIALDKCADELERIARENAELCRLTDYNFACAERNGAELATLKQKIAEAPVFLCEADVISGRDYDYISAVLRHDDPAYQYPSLDGQRVAMLPVGGENGD